MTDLNKTFRFRKFQIYNDSRKFAHKLKVFTKLRFPKEELYNLTNQLRRAVDSIILNIAEGSDRGTDKDFALFLNRSHTSLNEVVSCLDIALDMNYISQKDHELWLKSASSLSNQLTAFRKHLLDNPTK